MPDNEKHAEVQFREVSDVFLIRVEGKLRHQAVYIEATQPDGTKQVYLQLAKVGRKADGTPFFRQVYTIPAELVELYGGVILDLHKSKLAKNEVKPDAPRRRPAPK